ncbi:MAG: adenosine kinase [Prevotellaceae bacterium]|jgi:sugar/nucleoside kinase (ribokinase family)|nr:adenosine kinase [Prevotellaceae bacterium]
MKSILGMGNALVDILAVTPNSDLLEKYSLPLGSMQLIEEKTANGIYEDIKQYSPSIVAGGSAANTTVGASQLGMRAGFLGKIGKDELGKYYENNLKSMGVCSLLLKEDKGTGRAMVVITPDAERTFAVYLGAAMDMNPAEIDPDIFNSYDYLHIEGYLIQDHALIERAMKLAKEKGKTVSLDLASYNVVESNVDFLHRIVEQYADIVFANEQEAKSFTGKESDEAVAVIAEMCDIAVVKIGGRGSLVRQGSATCCVPAIPVKSVDFTGAGDLYASGFLYGLSCGKNLETSAKIGTVCAGEIIQVIGTKLSPSALANIQNTIKTL